MGMSLSYYTAAMVLDLPEDGNRYETVHGELLVTPAPRAWHQFVLFRLAHAIAGYLERYPVGVGATGGDISWSDDTLVIPDLLVADRTEARTLSWDSVKTLLLVVEVVSPSSAHQDRVTKRRLYQDVGVPLYWLVDADRKVVEVWTPEVVTPTVERTAVRWHPSGAGEALVIDLENLFRPI